MRTSTLKIILFSALLFCGVLGRAERLSTPPIKIIDPRNQNQVLILTTMWCNIPDAYQYGVETSRDSLYAPKEGCYWLDDQNKFIFIESERYSYQKVKVLTISSGKGQAISDFMTLAGRERIAAKQSNDIDKFKLKTQQDKPASSPVNTPRNSGAENDISLGLEDAKKKCMELGFKTATEPFGKCVLQLSK